MKWLPFLMLLVFTAVLQTTLAPVLAIGPIRPDWMLLLAVHYAIWGRWPDAALAAWGLGFAMDLCSANIPGQGTAALHALTYGAAACAILYLRVDLFREHWLTQPAITFVFTWLVHMVIGLVYVKSSTSPTAPGFFGLFGLSFLTALYTAVWTPYLLWPLKKLRKWTGLVKKRDLAIAV